MEAGAMPSQEQRSEVHECASVRVYVDAQTVAPLLVCQGAIVANAA